MAYLNDILKVLQPNLLWLNDFFLNSLEDNGRRESWSTITNLDPLFFDFDSRGINDHPLVIRYIHVNNNLTEYQDLAVVYFTADVSDYLSHGHKNAENVEQLEKYFRFLEKAQANSRIIHFLMRKEYKTED